MQYSQIIEAGFKTEAAYVAKLLKTEFKQKFPATKFSVKSDSYTGGDSIRISFVASTTSPKVKEVEALTAKYQAGHFDWMTDMYEITNRTDGPTVKYIFVDAVVSDEVRAAIAESIRSDFGITLEQWNDTRFMYGKFQDASASTSMVWREIRKQFYDLA